MIHRTVHSFCCHKHLRYIYLFPCEFITNLCHSRDKCIFENFIRSYSFIQSPFCQLICTILIFHIRWIGRYFIDLPELDT